MIFQKTGKSLKGELYVPGDKSISHRSIMFGAISKGDTRINNFLYGADCLSTISCFRKMGIEITDNNSEITVHGKGLYGLKEPSGILDCGNSGTTTRLISGILSAQDFTSSLTGDESIKKRPMERILKPLSLMGADIKSIDNNGCVPLLICGSHLHGISYESPVASAQVKSAILLAGLYADGVTKVTEPYLSRNHTETMLKYFGADIISKDTTAIIRHADELYGRDITVPGDISSAAFFIAAGLMIPGSEILLHNVGINPTRAGMIEVCKAMGGDISLIESSSDYGEPSADILVKYSRLKGTTIEGSIIPSLIDEIPIIAAMACLADGDTVIKDASELKVKESNRLDIMVKGLRSMGADVDGTDDGMIIHGGKKLHGSVINSRLDHRIAMTYAILGSCAEGETEIIGSECVNISYPNFYSDFSKLQV